MKKQTFETMSIRTQSTETLNREHSVPLYLTSSFTFDNAEQGSAIFNGTESGSLYSRFSNPNTDEFIHKLCLLENYEDGVSTASGMAAVYTSLVTFLQSGDHIIASKNSFGNTLYIVQHILPKMGVDYTLVDLENHEAWTQAIKSNTKLLYLETPSNPTLKIADLSFFAQISKENNIISIVDNCFATPYIQNPSKFGIDICIHSATKYIDGQGRVLGGAILGSNKLIEQCYDFLRRTGACLSPFNAWILSKSIETLAVRMERHCSNASTIANWLNDHSLIEKVYYPFLKSGRHYQLAKKQMKLGGGLVAFELKGDYNNAYNFLNNLKLHSLTANLGDTRSIATHPASTTHSKLSNEQQKEMGISDNFIRLSVGLEHVTELISDIDQSLKTMK